MHAILSREEAGTQELIMDIRVMAADMIDYNWVNGMDTTTIWIRE